MDGMKLKVDCKYKYFSNMWIPNFTVKYRLKELRIQHFI
jgi:hypothetical protein